MPLDPHPTAEADAMGQIAERLWRRDVRATDARYGIADGYVLLADNVHRPHSHRFYLVEVKAAQAYEPPPWRGHGLDAAQADRYMEIYRLCAIRTRLVIYDPEGYRYAAWIDDLERDESITTAGTIKRPRRIYPLTSFDRRERPELTDALRGRGPSGETAA